jgi:hypothetical protein
MRGGLVGVPRSNEKGLEEVYLPPREREREREKKKKGGGVDVVDI